MTILRTFIDILSVFFSAHCYPQSSTSNGKEVIVPPLTLFLVPTPLPGASSNSLLPAFPVWWPFLTSFRGEGETRSRIHVLAGEAWIRYAQSPEFGSCTTYTERLQCTYSPSSTHTDPPTQIQTLQTAQAEAPSTLAIHS